MENMHIKAERDYMSTILEKVTNGEFLIPEFQRDFVWEKRQMIALFDSIIKGFPIGSIILWAPQNDEFDHINNIGGVTIEKCSNPRFYVLDGRQRLTTLLSVLSEKGDNCDSMYVDLNDFSILGKRNKDKKLLKLSSAFDSYAIVDYIESLKEQGCDDAETKVYADRAKKLNKILMSYEIGYITVNGGGIDDAVEIFSRLNSQGTNISPDFMIQALTFNSKTHFRFGDEIQEILDELDKYNFSSLKRDIILKCVANYTDKAFIDVKTEDIIKINDLPLVMQDVKRSVKEAVKFLYKECFVIDVKLLPYTYQLVMLALFFKHNKEVNIIQKEKLKKWFFYTSYTNYFTNTSLSNIRKDIDKFRLFSEENVFDPIDYNLSISEVKRNGKDEIKLGSVSSCCFVLSSLSRLEASPKAKLIPFTIPNTGNKKVFNTIWCTSLSQRNQLDKCFKSKVEIQSEEWYAKFSLNCDLMALYRANNLIAFYKKRCRLLTDNETGFLNDVLNPNI